MNRKLLALAVGAALALPVAAQAAPTIYGKLDVSLEHLDGEIGATDISDTTLESNKSRLGIRGEEKLSNELGVIYQVEYGVSVDGDSANGPDLSQRDRFLGLRHNSLGTLRAGRMNTPLKEAEGLVDVFNGSRLDMENVLAGQNRESNSIAYTSPKLGDALTLRFTHITEEGQASGGGNGSAQSLSAVFESGDLYVAAAFDNDVNGAADKGTLNIGAPDSFYDPASPDTTIDLDTLRVVTTVKVGDLRLGGLVQKSEGEGANDAEQTALLVSAAYTAQKWTFKAELATSEAEDNTGDLGEIQQIAVGADYQWTQSFKVYGLVGLFDHDAPAAAPDADLMLAGVGMALSF